MYIGRDAAHAIRFSLSLLFLPFCLILGACFYFHLFFINFGGFARDVPKFIKLESLFLFTVFLCFYLSIASFFIRFSFIHPLLLSLSLQCWWNENVSLLYVFVHVYFYWCADNHFGFGFQEVSCLLFICLFLCLDRSLHHLYEMNFIEEWWCLMLDGIRLLPVKNIRYVVVVIVIFLSWSLYAMHGFRVLEISAHKRKGHLRKIILFEFSFNSQ